MRHEILFTCQHGHIERIQYSERIPRGYVEFAAIMMTGGYFSPVRHYVPGYPCTQCGTLFTAEILERPVPPEAT